MEKFKLLTKYSEFKIIYKIYKKSFPISEQKSINVFKEFFNNKDYYIYVYESNCQIKGFCIFYNSKKSNFILLEYMAIKSNFQSKGIGSKLFTFSKNELLKVYKDKPILIEIDDYTQLRINKKRANFYLKNECRIIDNFNYILGLKTKFNPPKMQILIFYPNKDFITVNILKNYIEQIYKNVYFRYRKHPNISKMFDNSDKIFKLKKEIS